MQYDLYKEMEKIRGSEAEYGNIELSYDYLVKALKICKVDKGAKMLDIGTNMGTLPYLVHTRLGGDMTGGEMRADAIEKGKKKYSEIEDKLFVVDASLSRFTDEEFDVVTMFDVIEHIPNAPEYLREQVFRVLKPGGVFVYQTPNARINPIFEMVRTKSFTAYKSYHCSLQTPKSLEKILNNAGFKNIVIEKNSIDSEFNRKKLKKYFGPLGKVALKMFNNAPLAVFPNLWGYCCK